MSQKNWLGFLLRLAGLVLEMLKDYLLNDNPPEKEKTPAVGD